MGEQKPSIGRIVHYQAHGSPDGTHKSEPRAAIVTGTYGDEPSGEIALCAITPIGLLFNQHCFYDGGESPKGGSWHWPPRVP